MNFTGKVGTILNVVIAATAILGGFEPEEALHHGSPGGHGHGSSADQIRSEPVKAQQLEEIAVLEQRLSEYLANYPQQVEVLGRDEIKVRNFLNVQEAIGSMSGVEDQPSGDGPGLSYRHSGGRRSRPRANPGKRAVSTQSFSPTQSRWKTALKPALKPYWISSGSGRKEKCTGRRIPVFGR